MRDLFEDNARIARVFLETGILCSFTRVFKPDPAKSEKLTRFAEKLAAHTPTATHRMLEHFSMRGYLLTPTTIEMSKPKTLGEFENPVYELTSLDGSHCGIVNAHEVETAEKYCGRLNWHAAVDRIFGFDKTGEPSNETLRSVIGIIREDD